MLTATSSGSTRSAVCSPSKAGVQIAPSTYHGAKAHGAVSAAALADAYEANTPCSTCGWRTAGSIACANSGTPPGALVTGGAVIGWPG